MNGPQRIEYWWTGPGSTPISRADGSLSRPWAGIISMVVVMILTSLSVAREREFGTFDQLLVSPH